jgi:hypothetical protein
VTPAKRRGASRSREQLARPTPKPARPAAGSLKHAWERLRVAGDRLADAEAAQARGDIDDALRAYEDSHSLLVRCRVCLSERLGGVSAQRKDDAAWQLVDGLAPAQLSDCLRDIAASNSNGAVRELASDLRQAYERARVVGAPILEAEERRREDRDLEERMPVDAAPPNLPEYAEYATRRASKSNLELDLVGYEQMVQKAWAMLVPRRRKIIAESRRVRRKPEKPQDQAKRAEDQRKLDAWTLLRDGFGAARILAEIARQAGRHDEAPRYVARCAAAATSLSAAADAETGRGAAAQRGRAAIGLRWKTSEEDRANRDARIRAAREAGASPTALAKSFHLTPRHIGNICRRK